ncbi:uncharacterized protein LOC134270207 [Saccostrea cucullata]|uniref:uncharacterized protein LOC134270207 n=1 Tax=Saccostrea cuccullata TaxID=36930 RepID=UPI002ED6AE8A
MDCRLIILACVVCVCYGQFWGSDDRFDDRFENRFYNPYAWSDDLYDDRIGFGMHRFQQPTWRQARPTWGLRQSTRFTRQRRLPQRHFYQPSFGHGFMYNDDFGFDW